MYNELLSKQTDKWRESAHLNDGEPAVKVTFRKWRAHAGAIILPNISATAIFANFLFAGILLTSLLASSAAEAQVLRRYTLGQWVIQANAQNGSFRNCTATSNYAGGAKVLFMLTRQAAWGVGITNPNWNWNIGSRGRITYWVDDFNRTTNDAQALTKTSLVIMLADSTSLFHQIRSGHRMYFRPHGNNASFSMTLKGTSEALSALLNCVRDYR